jgi:hypothetical protein
MFKVRRLADGEIILAVSGRLEAGAVHALSELIAWESPDLALVLDLKDVVLVDRESVDFLRHCQIRGIRLRNCPSYIRLWIDAGTPVP